jgi:hypothetical protein
MAGVMNKSQISVSLRAFLSLLSINKHPELGGWGLGLYGSNIRQL